MLLDGVNHIAWISKDAGRLGRFYERVFDAVIGPTRPHGPGETMTVIDLGPATQLNVLPAAALRIGDLEKHAQMNRSCADWQSGSVGYRRPITTARAATGTARPATTCPYPSLLE